MRLLDEQYTRTPFYGVLKMTAWLRENGHPVNCKRVRRLLRLMGLEAIYPKPRLSLASPGHQIYPYLLRGVKVTRVNQVWSAERSFGWISRFRRLARDYERLPETVAGLHFVAFVILMLKNVAESLA
jgi:hypothetical protein